METRPLTIRRTPIHYNFTLVPGTKEERDEVFVAGLANYRLGALKAIQGKFNGLDKPTAFDKRARDFLHREISDRQLAPPPVGEHKRKTPPDAWPGTQATPGRRVADRAAGPGRPRTAGPEH